MYSLQVTQELSLPDGRVFLPGHDCQQLTIFEVSELLFDHPECFEPGDPLTKELAAHPEVVQHYADAKKAQAGGGS